MNGIFKKTGMPFRQEGRDKKTQESRSSLYSEADAEKIIYSF
jgi:hypothetical protein